MKLKEDAMDLRPQFIHRWFARNACPPQQELAGYADRQLMGTRRLAVERHLASCDACTEQVAFLVRTAQMQGEQVPAELMNKALATAKREIRKEYPVWKPALSGAFGVVILSLVGWYLVQHRSPHDATANDKVVTSQSSDVAETHLPQSTPDDLVRGNDSPESPFLFPASKQRVDATNLTFRWKTVAGATAYEIELLTDDGSVIWAEKVKSPPIALPRNVHLAKGATYFVRLRTHHSRGSIEVSKVIEFIAE